MSSTLLVAPALLAITFLVVIHEFGHLLVGRLFGIRISVFSLGFGKRLFGFQWGDTDYRVSAFPFGGYVRMSHADPFGDAGYDDDEGDDTPPAQWFSRRPAWQRLSVMLGGPAANLIFPVGLFSVLMVAGEPQPQAVVGTVMVDSPAEAAGLREGDRVVAVNGAPILTWVDLMDRIAESDSSVIQLSVERAGRTAEVTVSPPEGAVRNLDTYGMDSLAPDTQIGVDSPLSPAGRAGLVSGDVVVAVDGVAVRDYTALQAALLAAGDTVTLKVRHGGEEVVERTVTADPTWAPEVTTADDEVWRRWGVGSATWFVNAVLPGSAAERAGVLANDRVLTMAGTRVHRFQDVKNAVHAGSQAGDTTKEAQPLEMVVRRDGQVLRLSMTPVVTQNKINGVYVWQPQVGIRGGGGLVDQESVPRPYTVLEAVPRAAAESTAVISFIVERIGLMVAMEAPVLDNLGGPVAMVSQAKQAAEIGPFALGRLIAGFSISLGILNLLPIPVLDGGNIFMYAAEWVRGRPLPLVLRERAQQVGVIFLVLLTMVVFAKDSFREIQGWLLPPE